MADTEYVKQLGITITKLREKQEMTKSDLAKKANIDRTYLAKIEQGIVVNVSIAVIRSIAAALNMSFFQLIAAVECVYDSNRADAENLSLENIEQQWNSVLYPEVSRDFPVMSLFAFLMYLPLIDEAKLADVLDRISGGFNNSRYALEKIRECIDEIPNSPAKEFAKISIDLRYQLPIKSDEEETYQQYHSLLKMYKDIADAKKRFRDLEDKKRQISKATE